MREVVIFGTGQMGELAHFYFSHDSRLTVAGFTVDQTHLKKTEFCGLPVVPFEQLTKVFSPERFGLFVAVSYAKLNAVRSEKVTVGRTLGYRLVSYLSSRATVFPNFKLNDNCFILENSTIQPFANVGSNVTLWSGTHIGHHSIIEDDVFIARGIISGNVRIGQGSFIGGNAMIRENVTIGRNCLVGAGALVMDDQPDYSVVSGTKSARSKVPSTRLRGF